MGIGDLQFFDIIIFAAIAAFLIFRLRNVLGKRTGLEKNTQNNLKQKESLFENKSPKKPLPDLNKNIAELKKAYEVLEDFDHNNFLDGAKFAFETIINSFNKGDKKTLKKLLTEEVFQVFNSSIDDKNIDPESNIFSLNIEKVEGVVVNKGKITIRIKFISEQFKNNDESTKLRNEDTWSFEKPIKSKDPNWLLSST